MSIGTIHSYTPINPGEWLAKKKAKINTVLKATCSVTSTETMPASNGHAVAPVECSSGSPQTKWMSDDKAAGRQDHREEALLESKTHCYDGKSESSYMHKKIQDYLQAVEESKIKTQSYCQAAREERLAVFKTLRAERAQGMQQDHASSDVSHARRTVTGSPVSMGSGQQNNGSAQQSSHQTAVKWIEGSSQAISHDSQDPYSEVDSGMGSLTLEEESLADDVIADHVFDEGHKMMESLNPVAKYSSFAKLPEDNLNKVKKDIPDIGVTPKKITYESYAALWDGVNSPYDEKTMQCIYNFLEDSEAESDDEADMGSINNKSRVIKYDDIFDPETASRVANIPTELEMMDFKLFLELKEIEKHYPLQRMNESDDVAEIPPTHRE